MNWKINLIALFTTFTLVFVGALAMAASATTIYVPDNYVTI